MSGGAPQDQFLRQSCVSAWDKQPRLRARSFLPHSLSTHGLHGTGESHLLMGCWCRLSRLQHTYPPVGSRRHLGAPPDFRNMTKRRGSQPRLNSIFSLCRYVSDQIMQLTPTFFLKDLHSATSLQSLSLSPCDSKIVSLSRQKGESNVTYASGRPGLHIQGAPSQRQCNMTTGTTSSLRHTADSLCSNKSAPAVWQSTLFCCRATPHATPHIVQHEGGRQAASFHPQLRRQRRPRSGPRVGTPHQISGATITSDKQV